jgi:hypothetical protein
MTHSTSSASFGFQTCKLLSPMPQTTWECSCLFCECVKLWWKYLLWVWNEIFTKNGDPTTNFFSTHGSIFWSNCACVLSFINILLGKECVEFFFTCVMQLDNLDRLFEQNRHELVFILEYISLYLRFFTVGDAGSSSPMHTSQLLIRKEMITNCY